MSEGPKEPAYLDTVDEESGTDAGLATTVPALTVLHATDLARVGEQAQLGGLKSGRAISLSRLEPNFRSASSRPRPLADVRLSRKPLKLRPSRSGGLRIQRGEVKSKILLDGDQLEEERELTRFELERGVVMLWADRMVLLIHLVTPASLMQDGFGLVGRSLSLSRVRADIHRVSDSSVPVLLLGETGTGKDLVAQAIHDSGDRRNSPFVAVNMGAIPPTLAASELFGAVKGAYTGASQSRAGYFRQAQGGTLFLDEIGEMPADVQVHLLRALENKEIQPVGADRAVPVNVRVIAATDQNLDEAVADGNFRAPLLHRLNGYEVRIPSLRQRREDIGTLLVHFLTQELDAAKKSHLLNPANEGVPWLRAKVVAQLAGYDWPGNVRQLKNAIRQMVIHSADTEASRLPISLEESILQPTVPTRSDPSTRSPQAETTSAPPPKPKYRDPSTVGDEEIIAALNSNRWRLKPTASHLGVSRTSLYMLMDRCEKLRRASQIDRQELRASLESCHGDLDAMSEQLKISKPGLQRRIKELGLE